MDGITIRRGKMEATRTYSRRWWSWIELPMLPCDGVLTLGQVVEKSGEVEEDSYGVEEVRCSFPGGRSFAVRKLGAPLGGEDESYTTSILPRNSVCNCKAGKTRNEVCRHRDGLTALIEAGVLPQRELAGV